MIISNKTSFVKELDTTIDESQKYLVNTDIGCENTKYLLYLLTKIVLLHSTINGDRKD